MGCVADARDALAQMAHRLCGGVGGRRRSDPDAAKAPPGMMRPRNRHHSVIALAELPADEPRTIIQSVMAGVQDLFPGPIRTSSKTSLGRTKSMSAYADPKAVAREAVVLVMVGLPARGKSYLSGAVLRHLRLLGVRVRTFNAGELRRKEGKAGIQADYFSSSNQDAKSERERLAMECLDSLLEWMRQAPPATSSVGILDATNTTVARRHHVLERCFTASATASLLDEDDMAPLRVIFLESICDSPQLLEGNYRMKLVNDDYKGKQAEDALHDFRARVQAYEAQYEPLGDEELEFGNGLMPVGCVRTYNGGEKIVCCQTNHSIVAAPFISLLHAMHLTPRRVFLAPEAAGGGGSNDAAVLSAFLTEAEAQEENHIDVILGGTRHAMKMAQELERLAPGCRHEDGSLSPRRQITSETPKGAAPRRPVRTVLTLRALEPRSTGSKGGSPEQEKAQESYADLVRRMRSEVLLLIERLPRSVLVVCPGEDVRRVLLAHFDGCTEDSLADMPLRPDKVMELTRDHKGFSVREVELPKALHRSLPSLPDAKVVARRRP